MWTVALLLLAEFSFTQSILSIVTLKGNEISFLSDLSSRTLFAVILTINVGIVSFRLAVATLSVFFLLLLLLLLLLLFLLVLQATLWRLVFRLTPGITSYGRNCRWAFLFVAHNVLLVSLMWRTGGGHWGFALLRCCVFSYAVLRWKNYRLVVLRWSQALRCAIFAF